MMGDQNVKQPAVETGYPKDPLMCAEQRKSKNILN